MADGRQFRAEAQAIWQAGVDSVKSDRLIRAAVRVEPNTLVVCGQRFSASALEHIAVVGAGKAGAGMAAAIEQVLAGSRLATRVVGWVNVPADCVRPLESIHLHAARPAGVNEPTEAGVEGARRILSMAAELGRDDLCLVLLSGGGSALLPAPKPPVTLADKQAVTRFLMHAGATIDELNVVRKRLSLIKGGGLARASRAGHLVALIISDVVGDPLGTIASGPTCADAATDAAAIAVLARFRARPPAVPQRVLDHLRRAAEAPQTAPPPPSGNVANYIIGCNATAVAAAAVKAEQLGYRVVCLGSDNRGEASAEGRALARRCVALRDSGETGRQPICVLSGGEPIVRLTETDRPRQGGRNQQLVLASLDTLQSDGMRGITILAGGTDGEDGPTDAAGAWADARLLAKAARLGLDPRPFLDINDSYNFFRQCGGLLMTGPTHTNVMDLRVALVG